MRASPRKCRPKRKQLLKQKRETGCLRTPRDSTSTAAIALLWCCTCSSFRGASSRVTTPSPSESCFPPSSPPPPTLATVDPPRGGARAASSVLRPKRSSYAGDVGSSKAAPLTAANTIYDGDDGGDSTTENYSEGSSESGKMSSYWSDGESEERTSMEEAPNGLGDVEHVIHHGYHKGHVDHGWDPGQQGKVDDGDGTGRGWRHEDLKQLLQELEDTEIGSNGARGRYPPRPLGNPGRGQNLGKEMGRGGPRRIGGLGWNRRSGVESGETVRIWTQWESEEARGKEQRQRAFGGGRYPNGTNLAASRQQPRRPRPLWAPGSPLPGGRGDAYGGRDRDEDGNEEGDGKDEGELEDGEGEDRKGGGEKRSAAARSVPLGERFVRRARDEYDYVGSGASPCGDGFVSRLRSGDEVALNPLTERETQQQQQQQNRPPHQRHRQYAQQSQQQTRQTELLGSGPGGPNAEASSLDPLSVLQSGEFSDTGSAGTWTDAETEELLQSHHFGAGFDHLAPYGHPAPFTPTQGFRSPGSFVQRRGRGPIRPLLGQARYGPQQTPVMDLDYSAKVLDYSQAVGNGPSKTLTLRTWARLAGSVCVAIVGAFVAVSPNDAPRDEYLALFRRNLGLLATSLVGPAVYSFLMYDGSKVNLNTYVEVVTFAFTWGYLLTFVLELVVATVLQLCVLGAMEPAAFKLCPEVPSIFLPWVLRENGYTPSYVYSCVADLLSFCVGAPIVECAMMVWIVRRLGALPKRVAIPAPPVFPYESPAVNGRPRKARHRLARAPATPFPVTMSAPGATAAATSMSHAGDGANASEPSKLAVTWSGVGFSQNAGVSADETARAAAAAALDAAARQEPTHVHTYLMYVLGSAMGLKAACTMQRVLVYTKEFHERKALFALVRGFFPLFELCGSIIAMNLARREILGDRVNVFQLFGVAVSLNAYAIFRGTKPLFKWAASKPWDELQVKAWVFPAGMDPFQLFRKGFASVAWALVVLRVTAHVIKTYWRLNRLHSSRLRAQHEAAAVAAAAAEQRAAMALHAAITGTEP